MDWLQFISSMTSSLAWPVAAAIMVFMLRRQLVALLKRVAEITLPGGYKVAFNEALHEARIALSEIEPVNETVSRARTRDRATFWQNSSDDLESVSLLNQMLLSYGAVEELLYQLAKQRGLSYVTSGANGAERLYKEGIISSAAYNVFSSLQSARNAFVHIPEREVTPYEGIEFVSQAQGLTEYLNTLKK